MAPAQSMAVAEGGGEGEGEGGGGEIKVTVKSEAEEVGGGRKEMGGVSGLVCANNREDSEFIPEKEEDDPFVQDVDVVECADAEAVKPGEDEDPDATENSSSFGNTFSGSEDEAKLSSSDLEVDSQFSMENAKQPASDGCGRLFKRKKVTTTWRRFISPLTWRCQWLELRMKELHSQISIYDKELAGYKREKQLQSKMIELDDSVSRSVPLTCPSHKRRAMRRKKRKRTEDTVDISSYMSNHNIFSYYENKKCEMDGHSIDDACANQVDENMKGMDDHEWLVRKGVDSSLEQIFFNIEMLQSRVLKLKSQLDKVPWRSSKDISSTVGNFSHGDPPAGYGQSHSCSAGNNVDTFPRYHASECELEDNAVPGSAVSSYGDAADLDTKSTIDVLVAHNNPMNQNQMGAWMGLAGGVMIDNPPSAGELFVDGVMIDNQPAAGELETFEVHRVSEKPQQLVKEEVQSSSEDESTAPDASALELGHERETRTVQQLPTLQACSSGKRRGRKPKRKRRGGSTSSYKTERPQKQRLS